MIINLLKFWLQFAYIRLFSKNSTASFHIEEISHI